MSCFCITLAKQTMEKKSFHKDGSQEINFTYHTVLVWIFNFFSLFQDSDSLSLKLDLKRLVTCLGWMTNYIYCGYIWKWFKVSFQCDSRRTVQEELKMMLILIHWEKLEDLMWTRCLSICLPHMNTPEEKQYKHQRVKLKPWLKLIWESCSPWWITYQTSFCKLIFSL